MSADEVKHVVFRCLYRVRQFSQCTHDDIIMAQIPESYLADYKWMN
jgi:hypothetical protein